MHYYSPTTGGFYTKELHGRKIPKDAVEISERKHAQLLLAQSQGHEIVASASGPIARAPKHSNEDKLAHAVARVKRLARRKILAVASLERQSNDNAALALGAPGEPEHDAALERRTAINAIRAASNAIEGYLTDLAPGALELFNPATSELWP